MCNVHKLWKERNRKRHEMLGKKTTIVQAQASKKEKER